MSTNTITTISGTGIPVPGNDIDTDRIIPARYMKVVTFDGLGEFAFRDVRFDESGSRLDHPFNESRFAEGSVLIVNKNFGCGSSREHAPQALMRWGIRAIIGESFAEIFAGNCNTLGIPAVIADQATIEEITALVNEAPQTEITIDLQTQSVKAGATEYKLSMPSAYRAALTGGTWDSTAQLLANSETIKATAASLPYTTNFASP